MKFYLRSAEIDERPIYITGNFNDWNPRDPNYVLEKDAKIEDLYFIEISLRILSDISLIKLSEFLYNLELFHNEDKELSRIYDNTANLMKNKNKLSEDIKIKTAKKILAEFDTQINKLDNL